jgi:hypothetical protein
MKWLRWILGLMIEVALLTVLIFELLHFSRDNLLINLLIVILAILGIVFVGFGLAGKIKKA